MIIDYGVGDDYYGHLIIQNYPNLQSISVTNYSLQYLKSLRICNNEKLRTISTGESTFQFVKSILIDSIT